MLRPRAGDLGSPVRIVDFVPYAELPYQEADAVVTGEIIRSQPFLSGDGKCLYTEYTFKVTDSLKGLRGSVPFASGESVTILREGGAARLPSGEVVQHVVRPDIAPALRHSYLMFLQHDAALESFYYLKFWLVEGGVMKPVFPLDVALAQKGASLYAGKPVAVAATFLKSKLATSQ